MWWPSSGQKSQPGSEPGAARGGIERADPRRARRLLPREPVDLVARGDDVELTARVRAERDDAADVGGIPVDLLDRLVVREAEAAEKPRAVVRVEIAPLQRRDRRGTVDVATGDRARAGRVIVLEHRRRLPRLAAGRLVVREAVEAFGE